MQIDRQTLAKGDQDREGSESPYACMGGMSEGKRLLGPNRIGKWASVQADRRLGKGLREVWAKEIIKTTTIGTQREREMSDPVQPSRG